MSEIIDLERSRSTIEAVAESKRSREALRQASYYHHRAEMHQAMAQRARPGVAIVHRELACAYLAAAITTERGEAVDFAGDHRAEQRESLSEPAPGKPLAGHPSVTAGAPLDQLLNSFRLPVEARQSGWQPRPLREDRLRI